MDALKSAYQIKDYSKSYELSNFIISNENKANESQLKEAKYIKAVSLYELQQYNEALREFMPLPKLLKNSNGATAYLYIAKIYLAQGNYKKCEDAINELLSYQYTNDEINAEGMLILADSYVQQKDYANAKVLVETILNAKLNNPEIIQRTQEKLNEINRSLNENENKQSNPYLFHRMFEEYQQSKNTGN